MNRALMHGEPRHECEFVWNGWGDNAARQMDCKYPGCDETVYVMRHSGAVYSPWQGYLDKE